MPGPTTREGEAVGDRGAADLRPGSILDGRWRIETLLGIGGMGSVYRAEHVHVGKKAALKVLHADLCRSPPDRERFRREARVASRLRSPHVVEVLDFGEDAAGRPFLVMELLEGEPLRALLDREGRLAPARVVRLLRQLLDGLGAAHAEGIVHRDLKPENLWLSGVGAEELLRVLDFGIAKWSEARADVTRTQAGLVVGTPLRHTPAAVRASFLGIPSAALPAVVNLTLVQVEIVRWSEQAGGLAPAARARALAAHDALVLPVVRAFGGRRLACDEGGSVFAFGSPTDAVECAAAVQDVAARADARPSWTAELGIGVHQGEVR